MLEVIPIRNVSHPIDTNGIYGIRYNMTRNFILCMETKFLCSGKRFLFHFTQTEQQGRTSSMRKIYFKYWKNSETLDMIKGKLDEQREGLLTLC